MPVSAATASNTNAPLAHDDCAKSLLTSGSLYLCTHITHTQGRARRTDEAVERFETYETKLVQDPIFRQTIGASAPTSSLVAVPPKIGNWNVTIHERTRETQQKGPMKTLTRSLRPFPGGSLASTVRSENIGTGASAVGGGSKESKRKEVEMKHTYGARRLSKAPQDKRLPVKTLSKASIVGRGMTEVALSTTKLADILKASERVRPEAQVQGGVSVWWCPMTWRFDMRVRMCAFVMQCVCDMLAHFRIYAHAYITDGGRGWRRFARRGFNDCSAGFGARLLPIAVFR